MAITVTDPRPGRPGGGDPHPGGARLRRGTAPAVRPGTRDRAARGPAWPSAPQVARTGRLDFLPETEDDARRRLDRLRRRRAALADRRVEMTGPAPPAKMAINALNSGAKVWLADLEDASTPTWSNVIDGQAEPARRRPPDASSYTSREGKEYRLRTDAPLGRRRCPPARLAHDGAAPAGRRRTGRRCAGGLRPALLPQRRASCSTNGQGPYYYLPKMESHLEARLWNDVFVFAAGRTSASAHGHASGPPC